MQNCFPSSSAYVHRKVQARNSKQLATWVYLPIIYQTYAIIIVFQEENDQ